MLCPHCKNEDLRLMERLRQVFTFEPTVIRWRVLCRVCSKEFTT